MRIVGATPRLAREPERGDEGVGVEQAVRWGGGAGGVGITFWMLGRGMGMRGCMRGLYGGWRVREAVG